MWQPFIYSRNWAPTKCHTLSQLSILARWLDYDTSICSSFQAHQHQSLLKETSFHTKTKQLNWTWLKTFLYRTTFRKLYRAMKSKGFRVIWLSFDSGSATFTSWELWEMYVLSLKFLHSFAVKKKGDNLHKRFGMALSVLLRLLKIDFSLWSFKFLHRTHFFCLFCPSFKEYSAHLPWAVLLPFYLWAIWNLNQISRSSLASIPWENI